ncbi:MAG TPA: hypothetical protein VMK42_07675, partial [Anaeromyxobacteraceae bacterium]|nr:hypothetical protein [Anaeromyxobacteraceae bacterium]
MAAFYAPGGAGELLPRLSFLEPLLEGRRVLEIGTAGTTGGASAAFLAEHGAAAVLSLDGAEAVERAAAAVQHPFVQFRRAGVEDLPRGAFDLVVVHDGNELARDPGRIAELKALLSGQGVLVTAIPSPHGPTLASLAGGASPEAAQVPPYESFAAALAEVFPVVEVATQSPAVGYVIAAGQSEGEPDVTVDGSLAGGAEAAYYLFFCASQPVGLSGLTFVALPPEELREGAQALAEAARTHLSCPDPARLQAERDGLERRIADGEARLAAGEAQQAELSSRLREKDAELAEVRARLREAEGQVADERAEVERRAAEFERVAQARRAEQENAAAALAAEREVSGRLPAALQALAVAEAALQAKEAEGRREADSAKESLASRTAALRRAEEEAGRAAAEAARERSQRLEAEASAQATRAEAQAARAGLASALSRAEVAEARGAELERDVEAERRQAAERAADLEVELSRVRADLADRQRELEVALRHEANASSLMAQRDALHAELHDHKGRMEQAVEEAAALAARLAEVEGAAISATSLQEGLSERLAQAEARADGEAARAAELEGHLRDLDERARQAGTRAEEGMRRLDRTEQALARAYQELRRA